MTQTIEEIPDAAMLDAELIVDGLPAPDYASNYQPVYPDQAALVQAVAELRGMEPLTTEANITALRLRLASLRQGETVGPLMILGNCAELCDSTSASVRTNGTMVLNLVVKTALDGEYTLVERGRGQMAKPRSNPLEIVNNVELDAYQGDLINGQEATVAGRTPDPQRMIRALAQSVTYEHVLTQRFGRHVPAAHEALLLPYEQALVNNGFGLSGDLLWIGERTRRLDGPHIALAASIQNPIGVKIGPSADAQYIEGLAAIINPDNDPGRLILMLRAGRGMESLRNILAGIKEHASNSLIVYDIHGSTSVATNGIKHRSVERTIHDITVLHQLCGEVGLTLHGLHLETTSDENAQQCTETEAQLPVDKPLIDPLFNPTQLQQIITRTRRLLPHAA